MKASEVHNMKDDELVERIRQAREDQFGLRLQHSTGELENTSRLTAAKRDIARLLTVAKERGIDLEHELRAL
jgi:large subunit ribosomal protein L29